MGSITKRLRTYYLFARPSFIEGVGRVVDVGGTMNLYNESETEAEADAAAIKNDWLAVGDDFRSAINQYERRTVSQGRPA